MYLERSVCLFLVMVISAALTSAISRSEPSLPVPLNATDYEYRNVLECLPAPIAPSFRECYQVFSSVRVQDDYDHPQVMRRPTWFGSHGSSGASRCFIQFFPLLPAADISVALADMLETSIAAYRSCIVGGQGQLVRRVFHDRETRRPTFVVSIGPVWQAPGELQPMKHYPYHSLRPIHCKRPLRAPEDVGDDVKSLVDLFIMMQHLPWYTRYRLLKGPPWLFQYPFELLHPVNPPEIGHHLAEMRIQTGYAGGEVLSIADVLSRAWELTNLCTREGYLGGNVGIGDAGHTSLSLRAFDGYS